MHISNTELKASLRRCFEALDYFIGNYEDAADMIIWLQAHGMNGLKEFSKALPYLAAHVHKKPMSISHEDSISAIIDCHGRSAINCIGAAVDLANSKALENGLACVTLHNINNRIFVLKALSDSGKLGLSASAYWRNQKEGSKTFEYAASIKANAAYPVLNIGKLRALEQDNDEQSLTFICSSRVNLACELQAKANTLELQRHKSGKLRLRLSKAIDTGLNVERKLWEEINNIGANVLVENTEQSRKGAGE